MNSFKAEFIADASGQWTGNGLRFATEQEAQEYAANLSHRWTLVEKSRVVESAEPVNHRFADGKVESVEPVAAAYPKGRW